MPELVANIVAALPTVDWGEGPTPPMADGYTATSYLGVGNGWKFLLVHWASANEAGWSGTAVYLTEALVVNLPREVAWRAGLLALEKMA